MNNTLKLIKKIIFISNLDKGSIGFNNILIYGFSSGFAELLIFASSIYIISIISNDRAIIISPFIVLLFVIFGSILRIYSSKKIITHSHTIGAKIGKFILKDRLTNYELYTYSENIDDNIVVSVVNYTQIFVSSLQNISLAIAALLGILSIVFLLSVSYYINSLIIIISIGALYIFINKYNSIKLATISRIIAKNQRKVLTETREALSMDEEIFINNSSDFYEKKLYIHQLDLMKNLGISSFISSLPKLIIEFFILSFIAILIIINGNSPSNISYINNIMIILISCLRILPYAQSIYAAQTSLKIFNDAIIVLYKYLTNDFGNYDTFINSKNDDHLNYNIKISEKIKNSGKLILTYKIKSKNKILPLKILSNQISGIRGVSGCGKSTLMRSMIGLRSNNEIEAIIKKNIIKNKEMYKIKNYLNCGFIPQKAYISTGTIRENINQNKTFPDSDIINLLIRFNLSNNKKESLKFLNTHIGEESNINLSGGEIQRIAFIRALLRRPKLLFIDEATSALDIKNSKIIMESLLEYTESVIMIFHSNYLESYCHQILDFEKK